jgi:hypothetical protein
MKTDKEYPATHSMSTAWYCADEEGNVAIIDIEDDGPVPVGEYRQNCFEEVFWEDFSRNDEGYRKLNLKPEQISPMLEISDVEDVWEVDKDIEGYTNVSWMDVIIKIDMAKIDILKQAVALDRDSYRPLVCISEEQGLFYVDFFFNKQGVSLLTQNNVVLQIYKAPRYLNPDDVEDGEKATKENNKFPLYIYHQGYTPDYEPAMKLTSPTNPMTVDQLPEDVRKSIKHLPINFKETERIQLAELMPVYGIWSMQYVYDNKVWWQLASSDKSLIYYNESSNRIISKSEMDKFLEEGKAEEWDYDKHHQIIEENDD